LTLPDDVAAALAEAAGVDRLLVASDFDGVLAPLVLDPSTSRPLPGTVESLTRLAALPDTYAAVVSGRDLATLGELAGIPHDGEVTLIGSHGAEDTAGDGHGVTPEQQRTLEALVDDLGAVTSEHAEARLEHKPTSVVLHTRGMDDAAASAAEQAALDVAARHTGVSVLHGKHVVELGVVEADKGTALESLRTAVRAQVLVYFGDDVTDENVFRRLGSSDVGVKVGDGDTAARWRVPDPQAVAEALELLVERRSRR
jgi:trehalose 6-phosphate phosphatase